MRGSGFVNWKKVEFDRFLAAFETHAEYEKGEDGQESWNIDDCEAFAKEINGNYVFKEDEPEYAKSAEECQQYFQVFVKRYRETDASNMVVRKVVCEDYEALNRNTLINYPKYANYAILLQETAEMDRSAYQVLARKEYRRLCSKNEYEVSESSEFE